MTKLSILFVLIFAVSFASARDCGLTGSLDERIQDCNKKRGSFYLVAQYDDQKVLLDADTNTLWGETLPEQIGFTEAQSACIYYADQDSVFDIPGYRWRLPKANEYKASYKNGLEYSVKMDEEAYWTSRGGKYFAHAAYFFYPNSEGWICPAYTGWVRDDADNDGRWDGMKYMEANVRCAGVTLNNY